MTLTITAIAADQDNTTILFSESALPAQTMPTAVPTLTDSLPFVDALLVTPLMLTMAFAINLAQLDNTMTHPSFHVFPAQVVLTAVVLETDSLPSAVVSLDNPLTQSTISVMKTVSATNTMILISKAV